MAIQRRKGFKLVADLGEGPPVKLVKDGDKVKVMRGGKLVGYLTKAGLIRIAKASG